MASEKLLEDARVLTCCLPLSYASGELFQNPNTDPLPAAYGAVNSLPVSWGQMTAYREANKAGWDWPLTVGMTPCCELPVVVS